MAILISKVEMEEYGDLSIPDVINLTFSNGEKVTYQRSNEGIFSTAADEKEEYTNYTIPKLDLGEQNVDDANFEALSKEYARQLSFLNEQHQVAFVEAERLCAKEKEEIDDIHKHQHEMIDKVWKKRDKKPLEKYQGLKKEVDDRMKALGDPSVRLKIMLGWLRESGAPELQKAAKMLESDSDYIVKMIGSPEVKWDSFLSHVQQVSADLCRVIKDTLQKEGMTVWYDRAADRLDTYGMINGVVSSSLFTLVLTTQYFWRPYCVFEWCVATLAQKPIITICESDPRYGGTPIGSYELPGLFQHVMKHELIEVNRGYWEAFIAKLSLRIQNTLKSRPERILKRSSPNIDCRSSILKVSEINWLGKELLKEARMLGKRLLIKSQDGMSGEQFHAKCDGRGPTLIVVETKCGSVFGGFTSRPWDKGCKLGYHSAKSAWLFKLRIKGSTVHKRININSSALGYAVWDGKHQRLYGPVFGGWHDLCVSPVEGYTYCHHCSYTSSIFPGLRRSYFQLKECEVFEILNSPTSV